MSKTASSPSRRNGPIFIVGAPRSGTTLLQYRLRNHPRISLPTGESHFFIPLYQAQAKFGDLSQLENVRAVLDAMYRQNAGFMDTDLHGMKFDLDGLAQQLHGEGRNTLPAIIRGLYEKNALGEGKARWGDKTPYYVLHIPQLLEWFPDAQIVHLIRDGRDVALSLFGRKHDFQIYNTYQAAKYWQIYVEKGRELSKGLNANQYFELRYEDLLADPEGTLKMLCGFLEEEYSSALLDIHQVKDAGMTPLVHQPIKADNAGKWRTRMSARQIRIFESVAGDTLRKFNYELMTHARPLSLPMRMFYRLHNALAIYWHQWKGNTWRKK
jgi:hypothetical protein